MIRLTSLFSLCLFATSYFFAQTYQQDRMRDFQWISGIDFYGQNPGHDGFTLDFTTMPPIVDYQVKPIDFYLGNSNISDRYGNLQFYSNLGKVVGLTHETMLGGNHLDWGTLATALREELGSSYQEGLLILPKFDKDSNYYMLYTAGNLTGDASGSVGVRVNLAEIDMTLNSGLGKVIFKDLVLLSDSLDYGKLTACRHANGRDWWIIVPRWENGSFQLLLYDPQGFHDSGIQSFPNFPQFRKGFGNAVYSPDGSKYAIVDMFKELKPDRVHFKLSLMRLARLIGCD